MVAFCKASISHLLLPLPSSTKIPAPLTSRRLLLFSLSLPTLLLHESTDFSKSHDALAKGYDPVSPAEKDASVAINKRIADGLALLDKGRDAQANGDFKNALYYYSQVVDNYKDFAFSEYARVGRALSLYEVGDREEAIVEMEDVSISLKGFPEVHAALAAALYEDKHAPLLAENQFSIATLLDPHYTDISYVKDMKHWPPSLVSSLEHFITLS